MYDKISDKKLKDWLENYKANKYVLTRKLEEYKRKKNIRLIRKTENEIGKTIDNIIRVKRELARRKNGANHRNTRINFRDPSTFNYFRNLERMLR